jgi:nitroreductase
MDLYDVMHTTSSARDFTGEPVSDEELAAILDHARFAPSGGNRQGWRAVVVRDRATREALADLMKPAARRHAAQVQAGERPWNTVVPTGLSEEEIRQTPFPERLVRPVLDAAAVLVVCVDLGVVASLDQFLDRVGVVSGASIYPFVWNILLAARNEGIAGTINTMAVAEEPQLKELLGIPPHVAVAAVIPLGRPVKRVKRLSRKPVSEFATLERFDGPPLPDPPAAT